MLVYLNNLLFGIHMSDSELTLELLLHVQYHITFWTVNSLKLEDTLSIYTIMTSTHFNACMWIAKATYRFS